MSGIRHVSGVTPTFPVIEFGREVEVTETIHREFELFTGIIREEVSEGLIQPETIPPLHGH